MSLENETSPGDDNVIYQIIKGRNSAVGEQLVSLVNKSFSSGAFPSDFKNAKFITLHEGKSKAVEINYKPISLLLDWSNVFKRVMFNRVYGYFEILDLFYSNQFGIRKKHSTRCLAEFTGKLRINKLKATKTFFWI